MRISTGVSGVVLLVALGCGRTTDDDGDDAAGGKTGSGGAVGSGGSGAMTSGGVTAKGGSDVGGTGSGGTGKGGSANGGAGGGVGKNVVLGAGSWEVGLTVSAMATASAHCTAVSFTLRLDPAGSGLKVIAANPVALTTGDLERLSEPVIAYGVGAGLSFPSGGADCSFATFNVDELALWGRDEDADGVADKLYGNGSGMGFFPAGDLVVNLPLSFELSGVPDATAPTLAIPSDVHPLDGVRITASEPLTLSSTLALGGNNGAHVTLTGYDGSNGAFNTFSSPIVLPFGSRWAVVPKARDFAGFDVAAVSATQVTFLDDPGLFAQDGFESAPKALLTGTARLVGALGTLPAIAGTQSLLVAPGGSATLHLAIPSGAKAVRLSARTLTNTSGFNAGATPIEIGVIGGSERMNAPIPASPVPVATATGDKDWPYASAIQDISVPLTEAGSELVVRMAPWFCGGFCPPPQAFLIDDLRVE